MRFPGGSGPVRSRRSLHGRHPADAASGFTALLLITLFCAGTAQAQIRHEMIPCIPKSGELGRNLYRFAPTDTIEIVARRGLYAGRGSAFRFPSLAELGPASREPVSATVLLRRPTFRLSRLGCAVYGADRMAGTAAALGGLGMVGGIWGEKTTGYLMGAGAILGALWGSTVGAGDPGFRLRVDARGDGPGPVSDRED